MIEILEQHGVCGETFASHSEEKKEATTGSLDSNRNPSLDEKDVWRLVTKHKGDVSVEQQCRMSLNAYCLHINVNVKASLYHLAICI